MTRLSWVGVYADKTYLRQIEENGTERLFKELDEDKLIVFALLDKSDNSIAEVDLRTGIIHVGDTIELNFAGSEELNPKRLIYFRRVRQHMGMTGSDVPGPEVHQFIGWQCTVEGKNHKRVISFPENMPANITIQCE